METVRREVKTYQVELVCPKCGKGRMSPDLSNITLATYPPKYLHLCDLCGYEELVTGIIYPYLEYE
jgi:hypothetical protein